MFVQGVCFTYARVISLSTCRILLITLCAMTKFMIYTICCFCFRKQKYRNDWMMMLPGAFLIDWKGSDLSESLQL